MNIEHIFHLKVQSQEEKLERVSSFGNGRSVCENGRILWHPTFLLVTEETPYVGERFQRYGTNHILQPDNRYRERNRPTTRSPNSGLPGVATPPVSQQTGAKVQEYCLPSSRQWSGAPNKLRKLDTKPRPSPSSSRLCCRLRVRGTTVSRKSRTPRNL